MSYEKIFHVPIVKINCSNWQQKKKEIYSLKPHLELRGDVYTDYFAYNQNDLDFIEKIFEVEINEVKKSLGLQNAKIKSFWFENSLKNNFHSVHNHGAIGYSAVCYVDYCEFSHQPLVFISPFNNFILGIPLFHTPNDVKEGTIIFFPSSLLHFTNPNKSEKERLVISFNLQVA